MRIIPHLTIFAQGHLCKNVKTWMKCVTDGTSAQIMVTPYCNLKTKPMFYSPS